MKTPVRNWCDRDAPKVLAVQEFNDRPVLEPQTENSIPGELTFSNEHYQYGPLIPEPYKRYRGFNGYNNERDPMTATVPERGWKSWIVTAAESGEYSITLQGSGGPAQLIVDDQALVQGDDAGGLNGVIRLTAGVHAIKVKSLGGPVTVEKISVE